ncbi:MAG: ferrous iron transport protein A [Firmicutes bacterium]|nr:ferrous iron transport protein A [Bacillota bacterium]
MSAELQSDISPLAQLPPAAEAEIINLNIEGQQKRRLLDLGFVPGTKIKVAFPSPLGDPKAYQIRNTLLALRDAEAVSIMVRRLDP